RPCGDTARIPALRQTPGRASARGNERPPFLALQAWIWVLLTNAGRAGGRTSDRASADSGDIGCCGATLIVARIQSLEGSDPPSGRRQHTYPPAAARPPGCGWPPWAPEDTHR